MPALILELDNVTNLPDGGPTSFTVLGSRSVDIGRDTYLDWTLPDPNRIVSGRHCEIRYRDGGYVLTDRSTNGTFLNGSDKRLTEPTRLRSGDTIDIGPYIIKVTVEDEVDAAPPPGLGEGAGAQGAGEDNLWDAAGAAPPAPVTEGRKGRGGRPVHGDALDWHVDLPRVAEPTPPTPPAAAPPAWPEAVPSAGQRPDGWPVEAPAEPTAPEASADPWAAPPQGGAPQWGAPSGDVWGADPAAPDPPAGGWNDPWGAPRTDPTPDARGGEEAFGAPGESAGWSIPSPPEASPQDDTAMRQAPPPAVVGEPDAASEAARNTGTSAEAPAGWESAGAAPQQGAPLPAPQESVPATAPRESAPHVERGAIAPDRAPAGERAAAPPGGNAATASPPGGTRLPLGDGPALHENEPADIGEEMPRQPGRSQPFALARQAQPAPPASPFAPPPPRREEAAAPARGGDAASEDYEAFLSALAHETGVPVEMLRGAPPEEVAARVGRFMLHAVAGLHALLKARATSRGFLRSDRGTTVEALGNNPLKFLPTPQDVLRVLFGPPTRTYLGMDEALDQSYQDVSTHQVATYTAMQEAVRRLIEDFGPEAIERAAGGEAGGGGSLGRMMGGSNRKAKLWDTYKERWTARAEPYDNGMVDVFMMHFGEAYGRAMRNKSGR